MSRTITVEFPDGYAQEYEVRGYQRYSEEDTRVPVMARPIIDLPEGYELETTLDGKYYALRARR